jgi:hypothetical protein
MTDYLIFAMSRSGHHAVINWIMVNTTKKVTHFNNCIKGWDKGDIQPLNGKVETQKGVDGHITLRNIEDMDIHNIPKLPKIGDYRIITINRDPLNWICSSIKNGGHTNVNLDNEWTDEVGNKMRNRIAAYKDLMIISKVQEVIDINYNDWFSDEEYRKELSDRLGLDSHDKGLNKLSNWGGGSSFSQKKVTDGRKLDVLNRWKTMSDNPRFKSLIDDDLKKITKEYFKIDYE